MHIEDVEKGKRLAMLGLGLTQAEAKELRDTLEILLANPKNRHEHVSSSDYQTELTVWISEEKEPGEAGGLSKRRAGPLSTR